MTPEVARLVSLHDLRDESFVHTDLEVASCACLPGISVGQHDPVIVASPPRSSGNSCFVCGGITVQTGTCTTCTSCGTTGGCG